MEVSGEGEHVVECRAQDVAGNWESQQTKTFRIDSKPPVIIELLPTPAEELNDNLTPITATVYLTGSLMDSASTKMYLDSQEVTTVITQVAGAQGITYTLSYAPLTPMEEALHTVYVLVTDQAGNTADALWQFGIDTYTWAEVYSPIPESVTNQDKVALTLDVEPGKVITATISTTSLNGHTEVYTVTNGRLVLPSWPLESGPNSVDIEVEDPAGNTATAEFQVTYTPGQHAALVYASRRDYTPFPERISGSGGAGGDTFDLPFVASAFPMSPLWYVKDWELRLSRYENGNEILEATESGGLQKENNWLVYWDGKDDVGIPVPPDTYTYTLGVTMGLTGTEVTQVVTSAAGTFNLDMTPPLMPDVVFLDHPEEMGNVIWFSKSVAVWGTVPQGARTVVLTNTTGTLAVEADIYTEEYVGGSGDGHWLANLPLVKGQVLELTATAVDAAGNKSPATDVFTVGLSLGEVFTEPHSSLMPTNIGVNTTVAMTSTTSAAAARAAWVQAQVPTQEQPIELTSGGVVGESETWTGQWTTPASGPYQGVMTVLFEAESEAMPPEREMQIVAPYVDLKPPWLSVHHPFDGHIQARNSLTVTGKSEPFSRVDISALKVGIGLPYTTSLQTYELGDWQGSLELSEDGEYELTVQATDRAGNQGPQVMLRVFIDTTGPTFDNTVIAPRPWVQSNEYIDLRTELEDLTGVDWAEYEVWDLHYDGEPTTGDLILENGIYHGGPSIYTAMEGSKPFTLTASDWLGNLSWYTDTVGFIVDDTQPQVMSNPVLDVRWQDFMLVYAVTPKLYYGPNSSGYFTVTVSAIDPKPVTYTSDLGDFIFPDIFSGIAAYHVEGQSQATLSHSYYVNGGLDDDVGQDKQIQVKDRAGNSVLSSPFHVAKDNEIPSIWNQTLALGSGYAHVHLVSPSGPLYYAQGASGTLTVTVNAAEAFEPTGSQSGIWYVSFPALFYASTWNDDVPDGSTYQRTYTIAGAANSSGEFQLNATDHVGNVNPANILVLKDTQAPTLSNQTLSVANGLHVYLASSTLLYYGPGASGSLTVEANSSDPQVQGYNGSGVKQVSFPTLFGVTPPADSTAPYEATYTIVDSSNTDGSYNLSTMDNVDNSFSGTPVSVIKDFDDPTVSLAVEEATGFAFDLTWGATDGLSGPSGVYDVEYRDGEGGNWQLWKDNVTETGIQFMAIPGHSVYFRVRSKDRVDNEGQSAVMGPYTVELETRKYYYFGGQRVAMRVVTASTNQVYYLHGDHLGSVSLTTDSSGDVVAQARYMPYGEVRWESSPSPTDFSFTGQRSEQGFGLMDFNTRFYSARLGRFVSADSIVPNPWNPIDFDRYNYSYGNPIRFIDPTGHSPEMVCADEYRCTPGGRGIPTPGSFQHSVYTLRYYGLNVEGTWPPVLLSVVAEGVANLANDLWGSASPFVQSETGSKRELLKHVFGGQTWVFDPNESGEITTKDENGNSVTTTFYCERIDSTITCNPQAIDSNGLPQSDFDGILIYHEMAHVFNAAITTSILKYKEQTGSITFDNKTPYSMSGALDVNRAYGFTDRRNPSPESGELFADMFAHYYFNIFPDDVYGKARFDFMNNNISYWIALAFLLGIR